MSKLIILLTTELINLRYIDTTFGSAEVLDLLALLVQKYKYFTGTKVQILTQKTLLAACERHSSRLFSVGVRWVWRG